MGFGQGGEHKSRHDDDDLVEQAQVTAADIRHKHDHRPMPQIDGIGDSAQPLRRTVRQNAVGESGAAAGTDANQQGAAEHGDRGLPTGEGCCAGIEVRRIEDRAESDYGQRDPDVCGR